MKYSEPPFKLTGAKFEDICLSQAKRLESREILTMGRYGVKANMIDGKWVPVSSLPDFEGTTICGRQFIIEAKSMQNTSMPLAKQFIKPLQILHMVKRARFNVPCCLLVHHHGRHLKTKMVEPRLVAYPVSEKVPWVTKYLDDLKCYKTGKGSIPEEAGITIDWVVLDGCRSGGPDIETIATSLQ